MAQVYEDYIACGLLPLLEQLSTLCEAANDERGMEFRAGRRHGFFTVVLPEQLVRRTLGFVDATALGMTSLCSRHGLRATSHPSLWAALLRHLGGRAAASESSSSQFACRFACRPPTPEANQRVLAAFEHARHAVGKISERDLREMASFRSPPPHVRLLCSAVRVILGIDEQASTGTRTQQGHGQDIAERPVTFTVGQQQARARGEFSRVERMSPHHL